MKTKVGHRRAYPHYRKAKPAPVVVLERQFVRTVRTLLEARKSGTEVMLGWPDGFHTVLSVWVNWEEETGFFIDGNYDTVAVDHHTRVTPM
jgi:hypothetical protein